MKQKRTNMIPEEKVEQLLEKYYDGATSVEEEKQLKAFLLQRGAPEQFAAEKAIFGYFESKKPKQKPAFAFRRAIKWSVAAAVVVAVAVSANILFFRPQFETVAYVDGKKITDVITVKSLAFKSITNISSENTEIEDNLRDVADPALLENQLEIFSGINF